jgi:hypothetical protein
LQTLKKRNANTITNPFYDHPVQSGLFVWRIAGQKRWGSETYKTDKQALLAAKAQLLNASRIGKHTIVIGVTNTAAVNSEALIARYQKHLSLGFEYDELFSAMGIHKKQWPSLSTALASNVAAELIKYSEEGRRTTIDEVTRSIFTLIPKDVGIDVQGLPALIELLKSQYKSAAPDWAKVTTLQSLLVDESKRIIAKKQLPLSVEVMQVWQGFDHTKDRYHVVCLKRVSSGRFNRETGDLLCKKAPQVHEKSNDNPVPCLSCLERLAKLAID